MHPWWMLLRHTASTFDEHTGGAGSYLCPCSLGKYSWVILVGYIAERLTEIYQARYSSENDKIQRSFMVYITPYLSLLNTSAD